MDESDQILTIEELRSLRDRMGAEAMASPAVAPQAVASAPEPEEGPTPSAAVPPQPAVVPQQPRADPWEDMRRRAQGQRSWVKPLTVAGGLALVGGVVTALVISGHHRSGAPSTPQPEASRSVVPVPVASAPAGTLPMPVSVSAVPESPASEPALPPVPSATASSPPADDATASRVAPAPAPRATVRPKPAPAPPRQLTGPAANGGSPDTGAEQAVAPAPQPAAPQPAPGEEPTLTRTPTSWSPKSPS